MKNLHRHLVLIFLLLATVSGLSQSIDSLKSELKKARENSDKIDLMLSLVKAYNKVSHDSVVQTFQQIDELIDLNKNDRQTQLYYMYKGQSAINRGNDTEALELFKTAHINATKNNEWNHLLHIKFNLIKTLKETEAQDEAIKQGIDALKYEADHPDPITKPKIYNTLAGVYQNLGQIDKAIDHYETALNLYGNNKDSSSMVLALANLAGIYSRQKDNQKSLRAYFDALDFANRVSNPRVISSLNRDICLTYMMLQKMDSAEYFIQRAIDISKEVDIPDLEIENSIMQCLIFSQSGKCDKALPILNDLLVKAQELKNLRWEKNIVHVISDCLVKNKKYEEAIEVYKKRLRIHRKVYEEDISKAVSEASVKYETEKKDAEIERLAIQEKLRNEQISRQRLGLIGALVGSGILGFFLFRLRQKNEEIDKKNNEKDILLREIHHRVKNNLQVISALLTLQSSHLNDSQAKTALQEGQDRVQSMALIHKDLYQHDNLKGVNTREYLKHLTQNLLESYRLDENITLHFDIENINLDVDTMIPVGLLVNELISNALKYAFKGQANGQLKLVLVEENNHLLLSIIDNGIGISESELKKKKSFGYSLIQSFARKLDAEITFKDENGLGVHLAIKNYKKV